MLHRPINIYILKAQDIYLMDKVKDTTCAISSESRGCEDVKCDLSSDVRYKDKDKDKGKTNERPHMCYISENDTTQGY